MYRSYSALCFSVSVKYNAVQELDLKKVIMYSPLSCSMSRMNCLILSLQNQSE